MISPTLPSHRPVEVGHYDGDGQGDTEGPADAAEGGHQLAGGGGGGDVPVPGAGHGDDGPVQGLGQRVEHRVRLVLLQGVRQPGHDEHAHADSHCEEQQLSLTVTESVAQGLEARDMTRQLEDPQDPQNSEDLRSLGDVLQRVLGGQPVEELGNVEGEDAQNIDNIEGGEEKVNLL